MSRKVRINIHHITIWSIVFDILLKTVLRRHHALFLPLRKLRLLQLQPAERHILLQLLLHLQLRRFRNRYLIPSCWPKVTQVLELIQLTLVHVLNLNDLAHSVFVAGHLRILIVDDV